MTSKPLDMAPFAGRSSLLTRIRFWLISRLAGKTPVALNLVIGKDGNGLTFSPKTSPVALVSRSSFYDFKVAIYIEES